jgi:hypothetical protein
MTENPSHELATPEEWSRARHRETILRSLVTQSSLSETDIRLASKRMGVGRAHFYRLLAAYRLRPQTSTLLPRAGGRLSRCTWGHLTKRKFMCVCRESM